MLSAGPAVRVQEALPPRQPTGPGSRRIAGLEPPTRGRHLKTQAPAWLRPPPPRGQPNGPAKALPLSGRPPHWDRDGRGEVALPDAPLNADRRARVGQGPGRQGPGWARVPTPATPAYLRSPGPPFYFLSRAHNASRGRTAPLTAGPAGRARPDLRPLRDGAARARRAGPSPEDSRAPPGARLVCDQFPVGSAAAGGRSGQRPRCPARYGVPVGPIAPCGPRTVCTVAVPSFGAGLIARESPSRARPCPPHLLLWLRSPGGQAMSCSWCHVLHSQCRSAGRSRSSNPHAAPALGRDWDAVSPITDSSNILSGIIESYSWPRRGQPNNPTLVPRALSKHSLSSGSLGSVTTAIGVWSVPDHPLGEPLPNIPPKPPMTQLHTIHFSRG